MRIHLEDCDVEMPKPADVAEELSSIDQSVREKYFDCEPTLIGQLWCHLVQLSVTLGKIFDLHSSGSSPIDSMAVGGFETELRRCTAATEIANSSKSFERFFAFQVGIHHE